MDTKNKPTNKERFILQQQVQQVYSGPLPPPQDLANYEKVYAGSAKIIVEAFEKQINHRIEIEKTVIESREKQSNKGQWFAFIVAVLLLALAGFSLIKNYPTVATIICSMTLGSVIYTFITGKKQNKNNQQTQSK